MAKHCNEDTGGVPISILDCGTSATVVVENETNDQLYQKYLREREGVENQAN